MQGWRRAPGMQVAGRLAAPLAAALLLALAACAPKPETPRPADLQAARQAALALDQQMHLELYDRLEHGEDPVGVYVAYRDHAQEIARDVSERTGVLVRRTSERVRDRANVADDWELKQLAQFRFMIDGGQDETAMEAAEIVTEGKVKYFRWMRPILVTETCLTCHGDTIDAKLLKLLQQDYADDEATGYFENELGGAYSVIKRIK